MTVSLVDRWRDHPAAKLANAMLACRVRFLVIGGWAVAHYGPTRVPNDLDLLVEPPTEAATNLNIAIKRLDRTLTIPDGALTMACQQLQLPRHLYGDILTPWDGESFASLWEQREQVRWMADPMPVIGFDDLIRQKARAAEQAQDDDARREHLGDLALLRGEGA